MAENIIVYRPNQRKIKDKYTNHITYSGKKAKPGGK